MNEDNKIELIEPRSVKKFEMNVIEKFLINTKLETIKMDNKEGLIEIDELLDAVISFVNTNVKVLEDGKISLFELPLFISPLLKFPKAIEGIEKVPRAFMSLSQEEKAGRIEFVKTKLSLTSEKAEKIIIASIEAALSLLKVYQIIRGKLIST